MYYHFAFVAISVTMFGMAVGRGRGVPAAGGLRCRRARTVISRIGSAAFAVAIVASYLTHLVDPVRARAVARDASTASR